MPKKKDIATRAYSIWEREGCPEGRDREHWRRAEEMLEQEEITRKFLCLVGITVSVITIIFIVSGIVSGFRWALFFVWLLSCVPLGAMALTMWLFGRKPSLTVTVVFGALILIFLIASMKTNIYGDALHNWIDQHVHLDCAVAALAVFALWIAVATVLQGGKR